jgi:hypothetical protein
MDFPKDLYTNLQGRSSKGALLLKRKKRILEALGWSKGTLEKPHKHKVTTLPNGMEVYFLKPGKEADPKRKRTNPHDMTPVVGNQARRLKFDDIWAEILRISAADFEGFKAFLALVYRNAYMIDHVEVKPSLIRYQPVEPIVRTVERLEKLSRPGLKFGLMGLLHFLDILGWNEDVKYHVESNRPEFKGERAFDVGRINTLLTSIRVPYQTAGFIRSCMNAFRRNQEVDYLSICTVMQQFTTSRGTCTPTKKQLSNWLAPFITEAQTTL